MPDLPHEHWCNLGPLHTDCNHASGCSCLTREVVEALLSPARVEAALREVGLVSDADTVALPVPYDVPDYEPVAYVAARLAEKLGGTP